MHDYLIASIMGVVEGITEFLPISSTGHLIFTGEILGFTGQKAATFEIAIQLGAILAVFFIFRSRFADLVNTSRPLSIKRNDGRLSIIHIAVAILPVLCVGFISHKAIKTYLFSPKTVIIGLIVGGIIMIVSEKKQKPFDLKTETLDGISIKQALAVGIAQCCALWPGVSRAASTILGGLYSGIDYKTSAEFSFLISVPVMFAATGYDMLKSWKFLNMNDLAMLAIGFTISFVVAIFSVKSFLKLFDRVKLSPFGWYRIAAAITFFFIMS